MSNLRFSESAAFLAEKDPVTLVGLGGIGKDLAEKLNSLGAPLIVWDGDRVEEHNCIPQNYGINTVGLRKTDALRAEILRKGSVEINIEYHSEFFKEDSFITPIVFCCVDSIQSRRIVFETWKKQEDRQLFIDGRLLTDFFQLFLVTPENEEEYYGKYLDPTNEQVMAAELETGSCTNRQNCYTAGILQGLMIQKYVNFITHGFQQGNIEYLGTIDLFSSPV